ncbi:phage major tail tube protein [Pantoea agglomerans]|uniref:phage major tail tube protein n=1 Tax=Enterobacter agglomerans TaxID=549 RepID=UPI0013BA3643|nr:phage major tail tube protein [Pantoea agglomerans]NEG58179.1 phage tail protein [Pantoea agglomerans]NEG99892.1 phage tail protein [Pantoea agglomerans]NEH04145.1 phage tail protein [Pantoea agglomerans]NEH14452.1 phage tail protein [Pantoea agglomerans]
MELSYVYSKSALYTQDGTRIAGLQSFTPPALTATIGNYKTAWMDMAMPVDNGMEPMSCEFKVSCDSDVLALFGFIPGSTTRVQTRRTYKDNNGGLHTFVDEMQGIIGTLTPDEHGSDSKEGVGMSATLNLSYYRLTADDREVYEIDPQNMIRAVNGVNMLADEKDALLM